MTLRVGRLVDRLLQDADATRWLSLASRLSPLAEAAPGALLSAIEVSLGRPDTPVLALFGESVSADTPLGGGAGYYADLLWALESLAWAPRWMPRVASLLARMSRVQLPDNWSNRPLNSLLGIFRSWMPQTAAALDQRIAVLDKLISCEPDAAFQLLDSLLHRGPDMASPASKPDWRDDDAGAAGRPNGQEVQGILVVAADRMIGIRAPSTSVASRCVPWTRVVSRSASWRISFDATPMASRRPIHTWPSRWSGWCEAMSFVPGAKTTTQH
jgi:hypothetical protein